MAPARFSSGRKLMKPFGELNRKPVLVLYWGLFGGHGVGRGEGIGVRHEKMLKQGMAVRAERRCDPRWRQGSLQRDGPTVVRMNAVTAARVAIHGES